MSEAKGQPDRDNFTRFAGASIPQHYDRGLGPVLFAGYGDLIARRAAAHRPEYLLETAAGTGIVTRLLRDRLPAGASLVATDLSATMLEVAKAKFRPDETVEFQVADAMSLPFPDGAFDVVVCQFGVMFFPDKDKSYREIRRLLRVDGHYLFSVFDNPAFNPCPRVVGELLSATFKIDPPPFLQIPYGYGKIDPIVVSLQGAEFGDIHIDVVELLAPVDDLQAFAAAFVLGSPLADQIRGRGQDPLELVPKVQAALSERALVNGRAPLRAILFDAEAR
ncbi:MAG: methyltransferase domain-containing protein [Bradyrhizobium sp.]|nr:MAG: methyltransferase domain-containing protein [Bradyrhizobium sp.]